MNAARMAGAHCCGHGSRGPLHDLRLIDRDANRGGPFVSVESLRRSAPTLAPTKRASSVGAPGP